MTSILEKLWKRVYQLASVRSKGNSLYYMNKDYHKLFSTIDLFQVEAQKTIEMIRENLLRSRPTIVNRQQLEDYIKRIEFANEIMLNLDILVSKTFDSYIEFINIYWEEYDNFDTSEQQKILYEKYDMSLTEWQSISHKIERFNELIKSFI